MTDQFPVIIEPGSSCALAELPVNHLVPALIADAGEQASWRYVEFFTANIRNANTRRAYARACRQFFVWCDDRGLTLTTIRPFDVAAWVEQLQDKHSAPGVKQQLAAVRVLFDWLITGQGSRHRRGRIARLAVRNGNSGARLPVPVDLGSPGRLQVIDVARGNAGPNRV